MKRPTPPAWERFLESQGLSSGRTLAKKVGITPSRAMRVIHGEPLEPGTLELIAEKLSVNVKRLYDLRGEAVREPFLLPAGADNLTPRQREAVRRLVLAMLDPGEAEGGRVVDFPKPPAAPAKRAAREGSSKKQRGEDEQRL